MTRIHARNSATGRLSPLLATVAICGLASIAAPIGDAHAGASSSGSGPLAGDSYMCLQPQKAVTCPQGVNCPGAGNTVSQAQYTPCGIVTLPTVPLTCASGQVLACAYPTITVSGSTTAMPDQWQCISASQCTSTAQYIPIASQP
jgi:hypothetical protein